MTQAVDSTYSAPTVGFMVSGHGYGHAVRCAEVAEALLERGCRVVVRSDAPPWLFPSGVAHLESPGWPLDVGVVQRDGLEIDIDATRERWAGFANQFAVLAEAEAKLLVHHGVSMVVGDVPPLAFEAAALAGIPSAALTNFGWDWIYADWPCFSVAIQNIQGAYARADVLLRLPLHSRSPDAFPAFRRVEDVPLVARHARRSRSAVRNELGLAPTARLVLLTFGAFGARRLDLRALGRWSDYVFVLTPPMANISDGLPSNVVRLREQPRDYASLLAACDVVVTKPGYGIASDCLANHVPVLFTDRGAFREYDVLAEALLTLGHARYMPQPAVLAGELGPHLDALLATPASFTPLRTDGAQVVADRLLGLIQLKIS